MIITGYGIIDDFYFLYIFLYFLNVYNKHISLVKSEKILTLKKKKGTSLVVQWLRLHAPTAGGPGSIPDQGTRSRTPQLKIPHTATKDPARCNEDPRWCCGPKLSDQVHLQQGMWVHWTERSPEKAGAGEVGEQRRMWGSWGWWRGGRPAPAHYLSSNMPGAARSPQP